MDSISTQFLKMLLLSVPETKLFREGNEPSNWSQSLSPLTLSADRDLIKQSPWDTRPHQNSSGCMSWKGSPTLKTQNQKLFMAGMLGGAPCTICNLLPSCEIKYRK